VSEFKNKNQENSLLSVFLFTLLSLNFCLIMLPNTSLCKNLSKPVIVVNPGHGGHDFGAAGVDGTLEKNVSLTLANLIIKNLQNKYRPILTRTGDYFLNIPNRTSIANNNKASLFISIHASGSYKHRTSGITISYLKDSSDLASVSQDTSLKNMSDQYMRNPWDEIHKNYITKSMELGKSIQKKLSQNNRFPKNQLMGSSLRVFSGANMPAVMIEVGYLSNPIEGKKLRNIEYLTDLAKEICNGIDDYFILVENHLNH
jgi:N-acetylmuramoyl-L-alanine amidase